MTSLATGHIVRLPFTKARLVHLENFPIIHLYVLYVFFLLRLSQEQENVHIELWRRSYEVWAKISIFHSPLILSLFSGSRSNHESRWPWSGPWWSDGHDGLSGWQQKEFPIHIYGAEDTYSGRIHFLKVWTTNKNPKIIAKFYYEYLRESKGE